MPCTVTAQFLYDPKLTARSAAIATVVDARTFAESPAAVSQKYADYAISLLESEYDCPSIATVQTLAILSCYEATRTHDTRGWLYAGE